MKIGTHAQREHIFTVPNKTRTTHTDSTHAQLKLPAVDLFLMHSPSGGRVLETWKEMLALRDEGLCRAVGVSNFGVAQLQGVKDAGLELPEVNQIELHVWNQQREVHAWHHANGIQTMGYCPLARMKQIGKTPVAALAAELSLSEPALAIRWAVESGFVTIPKSSNPERIKENAKIMGMEDLGDDAMRRLGEADAGFKASNSVNNMDLSWDSVK